MTNPPPPPSYNPPGAPMAGAPMGPKPDNYLVWAILSTLFCCLPLGIASIVFAAQVDGKYNSGDYVGAQASSAKAKKFAMWGAIVQVVAVLVFFVVLIAVAASSA